VGPSVLAFSRLQNRLSDVSNLAFSGISQDSVVIAPDGQNSSFGTEDPRVVYRSLDKTYYLLYSAVATNAKGNPISRLSLAKSTRPWLKCCWDFQGPVFPNATWSKSGALLLRDTFGGPHYLFWGDSTPQSVGIQWATTDDLINFKNRGPWIQVRSDKWDSLLVEAGPMPLPLSDGNYLFLYNSARTGVPSPKPNWDVQYNVGFVILDKNDPSKILQRSDTPILSPELAWETGLSPSLGLTPNVVFVEGWAPYPNKADTFVIFYGAADSVVGSALLTVTIL